MSGDIDAQGCYALEHSDEQIEHEDVSDEYVDGQQDRHYPVGSWTAVFLVEAQRSFVAIGGTRERIVDLIGCR